MRRNTAVAAAAVVGVLGLASCGSSDGGGGATVDAEQSTTTTTAATTTTVAYTPQPTDFAIEIIETRRACFGSAGCNVTYTINPTYVGTSLPDRSKSYTIIYDVVGTEDPTTGSVKLSGDTFTFQEENSTSVPAGAVLSAVVTRVLDR